MFMDVTCVKVVGAIGIGVVASPASEKHWELLRELKMKVMQRTVNMRLTHYA